MDDISPAASVFLSCLLTNLLKKDRPPRCGQTVFLLFWSFFISGTLANNVSAAVGGSDLYAISNGGEGKAQNDTAENAGGDHQSFFKRCMLCPEKASDLLISPSFALNYFGKFKTYSHIQPSFLFGHMYCCGGSPPASIYPRCELIVKSCLRQ